MKKVALGLSGGVDSAVAAHLLKQQGYEVHCIHLNCFDEDVPGPRLRGVSDSRRCRGDQDRKDALAVALHLGLPFQVLDFRKEYQASVIDYFKLEYEAGRTPNPDVVCNRDIKFGLFYDWAIRQGFDYVATGHYADVPRVFSKKKSAGTPASRKLDTSEREGGSLRLKREFYRDAAPVLRIPRDHHKDQTYFLWQVPRERFERVLFPLGDYLKSEVRAIARDAKLPVAEKKDSTGICFIGEVRVGEFLKRLGVKEKEGEVVIRSVGNRPVVSRADASVTDLPIYRPTDVVIGRHKGVWFYTIGQRHGFSTDLWSSKNKEEGKRKKEKGTSNASGLLPSSFFLHPFADRPPLYVIEKDVTNNRLVVGFGAECYRSQFQVSDLNWLIPNTEYRILNKETNHSEFSIQNSVFEHIFVRIRHGGELIPCSVISSPSSVFSSKSIGRRSAGFKPITVILSLPQRGIAPGQSAVFYLPRRSNAEAGAKDGVVLGGGIIR